MTHYSKPYFSAFRCPGCGSDRTLMLLEPIGKFHCINCGYERWATSKKEYKRIDKEIREALNT